jgi:hypothetical protein
MQNIQNIQNGKELEYLKKLTFTVNSISRLYSLPFNIEVSFENTENSYSYLESNKGYIVLSRITDIVKENLDINSELLYYTGLCVHEIGHLIYSDFNALKNNDISYKEALKKVKNSVIFDKNNRKNKNDEKNKNEASHKYLSSILEELICQTVLKHIFNSLEDGRIENMIFSNNYMYSMSPALMYVRKLNLEKQLAEFYATYNSSNTINPILEICNEILIISTDEKLLLGLLNSKTNSVINKNINKYLENSILYKRQNFNKIITLIYEAHFESANSFERNDLAKKIVEYIRPYIKQKSKKAISAFLKLHRLPNTAKKWISTDEEIIMKNDDALIHLANVSPIIQEFKGNITSNISNSSNISNLSNRKNVDDFLLNKYNYLSHSENLSTDKNVKNIENIERIEKLSSKYETSKQFCDEYYSKELDIKNMINNLENLENLKNTNEFEQYVKSNIIHIEENNYSTNLKNKLKHYNRSKELKEKVFVNKSLYNKECVKIAKSLKKNILQNQKDSTHRGFDHGTKFASSSLYRVNIDGKIFQTTKQGQNPDIAVSLLIDTSSSMAYENKIENTVKSAYKISRIMQMVNVPFSINTHATYNNKVMYNQLVPYGKNKNVKTLDNLFDLYAYGDTKEYEAIEETLKNLAKNKKNNQKGIVFTITDGLFDQKKEIKNICEVYSRLYNIDVIAIGIGEKNDVEKSYIHSINCKNIQNLDDMLIGKFKELF